jgi:hypothetical protein
MVSTVELFVTKNLGVDPPLLLEQRAIDTVSLFDVGRVNDGGFGRVSGLNEDTALRPSCCLDWARTMAAFSRHIRVSGSIMNKL